MNRRKEMFLFFGLALTAARPALAGTYYVSPGGSAVWSDCQSRAAPCSPKSAMGRAMAGDTVVFLEGVYRVGARPSDVGGYEHSALEPSSSGSAVAPIVFKSEKRLLAVLDGSNNAGEIEANVIGVNGKTWIVLDGFKVLAHRIEDGAPLHAKISVRNASNVIVRNCDVSGAVANTAHTYNIEGVRVEDSSAIEVSNCYIHGFRHSAGDHNVSGYKSYNASQSKVLNCTFFDNTAAIYDKEQGNGNLYAYNFIDYCDTGFLFQSSIYPNGNHVIRNNVILDAGTALEKSYGDTNVADNYTVFNNTIYNSPRGVVFADGDNWQFWNNIVVGAATRSVTGVGPKGVLWYSDYNDYFNGQVFIKQRYTTTERTYASLSSLKISGALYDGGNPDINSITADPKFVDVARKDFRLDLNSPCIGRGRDGMDMGAYGGLASGSVIGYAILSSPANLRAFQ
jgi:hypothetical protein